MDRKLEAKDMGVKFTRLNQNSMNPYSAGWLVTCGTKPEEPGPVGTSTKGILGVSGVGLRGRGEAGVDTRGNCG